MPDHRVFVFAVCFFFCFSFYCDSLLARLIDEFWSVLFFLFSVVLLDASNGASSAFPVLFPSFEKKMVLLDASTGGHSK